MKPYKILKHHNLLVGLYEALDQFLEPKQYANKVLERLFKKHRKWGSKDRAFVSEAFYDIIRWKKRYEFYTQKPFESQYLYDFIVAYLLKNDFQFPSWDELETVNFKTIKKQLKLEPEDESIRFSMPQWMLDKFKEIPHYKKELKSLNTPAKVVLRVNTLKINKLDLQNKLKTEGILTETLPKYPEALQLIEKQNIFTSESFKEGLFELQDANSQRVGESVNPKIGERVIDACAGAGGKALHMACLMQNKGQIIALDIYQWKLNELKKRAKRAGAHNIQSKLVEDSKTLKRLKDSADKVLIDAPCSGLGVLRRNPDAKWKLSEAQFENILKEQKEILQTYSKLVKKEGILTYVTCSILSEENEQQVEKFLEENSAFQLQNQRTLYPSETGYDGFFIAQMKRTH